MSYNWDTDGFVPEASFYTPNLEDSPSANFGTSETLPQADVPASSDYGSYAGYTTGSDTNATSMEDVAQAISELGLSDTMQQTSASMFYDFKGNNPSAFVPAGTAESQDASGPSMSNRMGGLINGAGNWLEKNPKLAATLLGAASNAMQGRSAKEAAEKLAASRINEINHADNLKKEKENRMNASISGLRPIGIIAKQRQLQRNNGANVFSNGTIIKA